MGIRLPFNAPESIQATAIDCGPAALRSFLAGAGLPTHYERLREACQTDVNGTSIDRLEDVARSLGIPAQQYMVPPSALAACIREMGPFLLVTRNAARQAHFVVVWRAIGQWVQIMDPASGRRWLRLSQLLTSTFSHRQAVTSEQLEHLLTQPPLWSWLTSSVAAIGIEQPERYLTDALKASDWRDFSALESGIRFVRRLLDAKEIQPSEARGVLDRYRAACRDAGNAFGRAAGSDTFVKLEGADSHLVLNGAVILAVPPDERARLVPIPANQRVDSLSLRGDLKAAVLQSEISGFRALLDLLGRDGRREAMTLGAATLFTVFVTVAEALVLRAAVELPRMLPIVRQRAAAGIAFCVFLLIIALVEFVVARGTLRLGRLVELRLRMQLLSKLPRLPEWYFRTRPTSDLAYRAHTLQQIGSFPQLLLAMPRSALQLVVTELAITWIDPMSGIAAAIGAIAIGLAVYYSRTLVSEYEARVQSHTGALGTVFLESLLGILPVRTHSAQASLRSDYQIRLTEWLRAGLANASVNTVIQMIIGPATTLTLIAMVAIHLGHARSPESLLLLLFWAQRMPNLAREFADNARAIPRSTVRIARILDPLRASEGEDVEQAAPVEFSAPVAITLEDACVIAAGERILDHVDLGIAGGEHVAIVGRSGAGKSTLVGILLGLSRIAHGRVLIDGRELDAPLSNTLRRRTVWVDPTVQLWDQTLLENLWFGNEDRTTAPLAQVLADSDLDQVLPRLPDGLQTILGESGRRLSGGEGQRGRFARALLAEDTKLVLLDEPFRGLDRPARSRLLRAARERWKHSTLLCVTHDISETVHFERVLVVDGGRIVETGSPSELEKNPESHYSKLLAAEVRLQKQIWERPEWRRWVVENGRLLESST